MKKFKIQKAYLLFAIILGCFVSLAGCSGNEAGGGEWNQPSTTTAVPPTVTAVTPLANATAVPINIKLVTAAFSKAMAPSTLTTTTFTLSCNGTPVTGGGAVTYVAAGNVATLPLPAATNLPKAATCTATVTTGAMSATGLALAKNHVWTFTTSTTTDTVKPLVTSTDPATTVPGPTLNVPANTAITAIFNEDMNPLTITDVATFTLTGPGVTPVVGMDPPVTYNVASRTATFRPLAILTTGVTYTATIKGIGIHAATDLVGNALAGDPLLPLLANDYVWTFTTTAPAAPQPVSVLPPTSPAADASGVCPSATIQATFSVPSGLRMDPDSLNSATFIVTGPGPTFTPVDAATVSLDVATGKTATFTPLNPLVDGTIYTATIKGGLLGVKDLAIPTANEMTSDYTWNFTAGPATGVCRPPINLGLATTFGIASTAGITNTLTAPITHIDGDVVFNPTATCNGVDILFADGPGFGLCNGMAPTIVGEVITPLYPDAITAQPITDALRATYLSLTPANLPGGTSIAAGTTLGAPIGDPLVEGDNLFYPGVYTAATSILITGDLTLDAQGNADAEFVFQSASTIGTAPGAKILLAGGAKASNIWWQAGSAATLQTNTVWKGNILAYDDVTMVTGATSCGRLFAGAFTDGAFVFDSNVVSVPGLSTSPAGCE
jgi:hypothetical protein